MINYISRTRNYYATLGYPAYQWASFSTVPFTPLNKPLNKSLLTLITTAGPLVQSAGDQGPNAPYNAAAKFFKVQTQPTQSCPDLRISHLSYDRRHCSAEDANTWLPIEALNRATQLELVGTISDEIICLPTNRSQRATLENDCPEVVKHCERLKTDIALLVPT